VHISYGLHLNGKLVLFSTEDMLGTVPYARLTTFLSPTTMAGTVINKNTTTIHAMTPSMDPQHHLAYVFSNVDRSRGRGGSLSLFVVRSVYV
jgi:hypothetical protein